MQKFLGASLLLLTLSLAGCDQADKSVQAEDETNPNIRAALAAQREFNFTEAAKDYEAALTACPNVANAHFELGLLYADRLNDPIRAMYHFQSYIDARPNAENKEGAEKRLESIKIQFAATVPNSPIQNAEAFAKLQADNQNLLKELNDARIQITGYEAKSKPVGADNGSGTPATVAANPVKDAPDAKPDAATPTATSAPTIDTTSTAQTPAPAPATTAAAQTPIPNPVTPATPAATPTTTATDTAATPTPTPTPSAAAATPASPSPTTAATNNPPAASTTTSPDDNAATPRTYTIAKGDTLWSISKKYYPGQITSGIEKIKNANSDKLPEGKPLKIGVTLVIP